MNDNKKKYHKKNLLILIVTILILLVTHKGIIWLIDWLIENNYINLAGWIISIGLIITNLLVIILLGVAIGCMDINFEKNANKKEKDSYALWFNIFGLLLAFLGYYFPGFKYASEMEIVGISLAIVPMVPMIPLFQKNKTNN